MSKSQFVKNALISCVQSIIRFPFESITTGIALVSSILYTEEPYDSPDLNLFVKILFACSLSLVGFLCVSLYFSGRKKGIAWLASNLIVGGLLSFFIYSFSEKNTALEGLQFFVLNIALHLLVSFVGFVNMPYRQDHFWEFNKQLLIRLSTAIFYSFVLFAGFSVAILAITELFGFKFYDKIYIHLWIVIVVGFNTLFFLAGIPELKNYENELVLNYPKGLKKFTLYVLLPLLLLYLAILIGYEMKIILTLTLPVGWVSYLILIFSLFGLLSFLLVHPIAQEKENFWIYSFNRWFYFILIPLNGLLFWAILYRINLYGITHGRYYVLLMAIWLSAVLIYFIFKKEAKIKFIPISMFIAALFSIIGPQSASSVSRISQLSRFENYLEIIEHKKLSFSQEKDLSSIVDFLHSNYGIKVMQPLAKGKLDKLAKADYTINSYDIMVALGTNYISKYEQKPTNSSIINYYYYTNSTIENVHGYDFSMSINQYNIGKKSDTITIDKTKYKIETVSKKYGLDLQINNDVVPIDLLSYIISNPIFRQNNNSNTEVVQKIALPKYHLKILYQSVNANDNSQEKTLDGYEIKVLVKII